MKNRYLLVDGNYLFHVAKQNGIAQDFTKLVKNLEADGGEFARMFFYTRPPSETSVKAVAGWLKSHGWDVTVIPYEFTHQDSLYIPLVTDMFACIKFGELSEFTIISGAGALSYPLDNFTSEVKICATEESINKKLRSVLTRRNIEIISLIEVLSG